MAKYYEKAYANYPEKEQDALFKAQTQWQKDLNTCEGNVTCLEQRYDRRISELQITSGSLTVPKPILYHCSKDAKDLLTVYFYNKALVPTVVINHNDVQNMAHIVRSGSGTKYTNDDVLFWAHHKEATLKEKGVTMVCQEMP